MKKAIIKVLSIIVVLPILVALLFVIAKVSSYEPFSGPEGYYLSPDSESSGYILQFDTKGQMTLYHYAKERQLLTDYYYGRKTDYQITGEFYTNLFGKLNLRPGIHYLVFNQFSWFDPDEERRADVEMKAIKNMGLFIENTEPIKGTYKETIIISGNTIKLGDLEFTRAETASDIAIVTKIKQEFTKNGKELM